MRQYELEIHVENDVYLALHYARLLMNELGFSEMEKQKVLVAVSELTRNVLDHADGRGSFLCEIIGGHGLRLVVRDWGTGIERLPEILHGEPSHNRRGLGLGLAGAKRMMDEFHISTSKEGTEIVGIIWKGKAPQSRRG
ncbi:ATP-binding protein [Gorillibacterium sp. sgz5001074]|uniref:ATP-binding protein n=1 Tax=Gorillibacterium sp. sgz5001074 TaxID=3446695 RepID=UPI003F6804EA